MSLRRYIDRGEAKWKSLEKALDRLEKKKDPEESPRRSRKSRRKPGAKREDEKASSVTAPLAKKTVRAAQNHEIPQLLRRISQDLAIAKHRHYASGLTDRLNRLAWRTHNHLYRATHRSGANFVNFLASTFPRQVRIEWRLLLACSLMFLIPVIGSFVAVQINPEFAYSIADASTLDQVEEMYEMVGDKATIHREADSDVLMFGLYISNNIGIDFMNFALGIFATLGTIFFVIYNGLLMGTMLSHVDNTGNGEAIYQFVASHGPFELTALVISGMAGMRIGLAVIAPGRRTRREALRACRHSALTLVSGAAVMTLAAACIEAFWSPRTSIEPHIKYAVGTGMLAITIAYLALGGREPQARRTRRGSI